MAVLAAHIGLQGQRVAVENSYMFVYKISRQKFTCQVCKPDLQGDTCILFSPCIYCKIVSLNTSS